MKGLAFVLGTRPEIIKLSPLVRAATRRGLAPLIVHSGQHFTESMDLAFFRELDLPAPDHHLGIGALAPAVQVARILEALDPLLSKREVPLVVVQGDTNTTLAGALAAKKRSIPLAHVEAGLRSYDGRMPEEQNRIVTDHLADLLFCPTAGQAAILRGEGIQSARVHVVGNTIADAVAWRSPPGTSAGVARADATLERFGVAAGRYALLTLHRQENVDDAAILRGILEGIRRAAEASQLTILYPVHPRTRARLEQLAIELPACVRPVPPVSFHESLQLQASARLVLTDSGGLQEEAAILHVPCVTLRTTTERPETVEIGANILAGVEAAEIETAVREALATDRSWTHPYGDGRSAERILDVLCAPAGGGADERKDMPAADPMQLPSDGDHTGRDLGEEEIALVSRAIRSGTLNSTRGTFVTRFEKEFAAAYGVPHAVACASGTAAVHCAVAALRPAAGDEVITSPITDMGAITPILYEGAVPVFADVDPDTFNVTAATIAARITPRTRAIVVTHLFGLPCDMGPILDLAQRAGVPVIEDCAQAYFASGPRGRVGTLGAISCFSMQQGKHMTTGEGGIVTTADPALARALFLCVNKAWGYGDKKPDHYFPALNYRLTELQGAVAVAQLGKVESVVRRRREAADKMGRLLAGIPGIGLPTPPPGVEHSWWRYALRVNPAVIRGGPVELGSRLKERGISSAPRYIQKPAFECALFADWNASPVTRLPLQGRPGPVYRREDFPGALRALDRVLVLPWNERYLDEHLDFLARTIREEAERLTIHGS